MTSKSIQDIKNNFKIIGNSPKLNQAIDSAMRASDTDLTVLIIGENGSGKESFSKIIHNLSSRKHKNFIAINCGGIPSGTINSELFGHEKGSFTGATSDRRGYFEETNGGTIFLDEIGDMPLDTQAMLLRVLENGEYIRVGSNEVRKTNVRIIAATNVKLKEAVNRGKFREDLYYRLSTYTINVPPLRERNDDIILLFRKFAREFADQYSSQTVELTPEAAELLKRYAFPGNVRELRNIVFQLSLDLDTQFVTPEILQRKLDIDLSPKVPALFNAAQQQQFTQEELNNPWRVLYELKKEIGDLRTYIMELMKPQPAGVTVEGTQAFAGSMMPVFHQGQINSAPYIPANDSNGFIINSGANLNPLGNNIVPPINSYGNYNPSQENTIEDIEHSDEPESLSLENQEKEMITKALKKHKNKRKSAAVELGISERTLYRKIKQYDLDC